MPPKRLTKLFQNTKKFQNLVAQAGALTTHGDSSTEEVFDNTLAVVDPPAHDPQEDQTGDFIESTYPGAPDQEDQEEEEEEDQSTPDTAGTGSSSTRRRGKNKNVTLSRRPQGTKITLNFGDVDGRPHGDTRHLWSRHVGSTVRDPAIIPHRLVKWKSLSVEQLDSLWRAMTDPFKTTDVPIDTYKLTGLAHARQIWDRWRSDLNSHYVRIHQENEEAVLANPPPDYDPADWEYICRAHFFQNRFKEKSAINVLNRQQVRLTHHTGSKPFSQVEEELEVELERPPTFVETEMQQLMNNDKDISKFDLVERVFGPQRHGTVMGMGSGVRATHYRGDQRSMNNSQRATQSLRVENQQLREQVVELRDELRENRETMESRQQTMQSRQEAMEEDLAESRRQIAFLMAQFQNQGPPPS